MTTSRFSKRHAFDDRAATIEIRYDAPSELREVLVDIFLESEASPYDLRDSLCRTLRLAGRNEHWSVHDLRTALGKCEWFEVYDAIEGMAVSLRALDERWGGQRLRTFEAKLNDYFERRHIGWALRGGELVTRGPAAFEQAIQEAEAAMETHGLTTVRRELREALRDLSRRPAPDVTGAIQHAMAGLECFLRTMTSEESPTLGELLKRHGDLLPPPLPEAIKKLWGFASERGRHLREQREPSNAEAELVVHVAAAIVAYLARTGSPESPSQPTKPAPSY